MKVFMITDTHFGIYLNNLDKWLNMMENTIYNFLIPQLKKNVKDGDILIHLGDLFDNRTAIPINISNKVEKILKDISDIIPIHIMVGNHDLFNKGSNEVNSVRLFSYMNKNISVYENPSKIKLQNKDLILIPWVEKRTDLIKCIENNPGDYLFCHSDLNGCKMHLNSVAHRNADKIDVHEFNKYKEVFSGHVHIKQTNKNFKFIGSLWQMDRNDTDDQKGLTTLDLETGVVDFIPNNYSPVFRKFKVITEEDIDKLDEIKDTKDYIDLAISNNLLINNRKLRRKLEMMLEKGNFASVEYIDDIVQKGEDGEDIISEAVTIDEESMDISIKLEYESYIKEFIQKQKYENEGFMNGILNEYDEIIRIYSENYKTKVD